MKTGLTLGKFSPFHKGHQKLINSALLEMDHLIVVIYNSPETTNIPLKIRADWIRTLYPEIEVIEAWDGPTEVGYTDEIKKRHEIYLGKLLKGRKISAFYSGEQYGKHISEFFNAKNRIIKRVNTKLSGTIIRNDPYKLRSFLDPEVYKDFIVNIAFLGAPCTGKTTISKILADEFKTEWIPEYGREYWEKNHINRRLTENQLIKIAQTHIKLENKKLYNSNRFLFTDTNAITTYMFSKYYHGKVHSKLAELAMIAEKRYDLFFLCGDDIPYDNTWDRSGEMNRSWFQYEIESDLKVRKIPYIKLAGSINERFKKVKKIIKNFKKYDNVLNKLFGE